MIYKSYLVEQNVNILKNDIILIYGENDGLKRDLKKKLRFNSIKTNIKNTSQEEILKKQDLLMAKNDLDITKEILKIFNDKIKKINIT